MIKRTKIKTIMNMNANVCQMVTLAGCNVSTNVIISRANPNTAGLFV